MEKNKMRMDLESDPDCLRHGHIRRTLMMPKLSKEEAEAFARYTREASQAIKDLAEAIRRVGITMSLLSKRAVDICEKRK